MASLIPFDDLSTLRSASDVKAVADSAALENEKLAIAKLISSAANTGSYSVLWNHEMSEAMKSTLQGQGYRVTRKPYSADNTFQYIIQWGQ